MDFKGLYEETDKQLMKDAEDALNPKIDRVHEIIEYARHTGMKNIGIANCIAFNKEAKKLDEILTSEGFKVFKVNCKYGKLPFKDLVPGYKGTSCNPAGQAKYLEDENTQLNIMMGLCLGHDMIFNAKSKAPVTPLIVKDRMLKHQSLKSLERKENEI